LVAVAVVVPIVGVALIAVGVLFFLRRRKQRKDAEDLRRKEVEEYGFNPNGDGALTSTATAAAGGGDSSEMRQTDTGGYRGWGNTAAHGNSGRGPSTGVASTAQTRSPTDALSQKSSGNQLANIKERPLSSASEELGAMGPAAANNRSNDIRRGPSNASSSYSMAARSDGSIGETAPGGAYGQAQFYSDHNDAAFGVSGGGFDPANQHPVIRDNLARRATRIENLNHQPQPSTGISQNF
jgi:hypothetical protein